jgi:uncharacterized surface protein with fasciclin (FAS1) repeats
MSEVTQESKEIFAVYKQNFDKYFSEVERSLPQYLQSITNLQQAYTTAWKNTMELFISLQQEFANKTGTNTNVPPAFIEMINHTTEEFIKIRSIQNKTALAMIDAVQQNIKMFSDNIKTFAKLNESIIESWISAYTPT